MDAPKVAGASGPTHLPAQAPAPAPSATLNYKSVVTPAGTLNITLAPAPKERIPPYQDSAIMVPAFAFISVILTILFGLYKMKTELADSRAQAAIERDLTREQAKFERDHDAAQAHQERITTARREVYSGAVAALVETQIYIGNLPSLRIKDINVVAAAGKLTTALAQVSILGEMDTVLLSRELQRLLMQLFAKAVPQMIPIESLKDDIAALQKVIETLEEKIDAKKTSALANGGEEWRDLTETYGQAANSNKELSDKFRKLTALQMEYSTFGLAESRPLFERIDELIEMIRTELDLDTDLERLRASTATMYKSADEVLSGLEGSMAVYIDTPNT